MEKIGFIGLGIMGGPMVSNLLASGCQVYVHDLSKAAVQRACKKGAAAAQPIEIAENCSLVFLSLPNGQVGETVLFGDSGLAKVLRPGAMVVDTSSITPEQARSCGERLGALGVDYLDAPVSGGEPGAIQGPSWWEESQPLFSGLSPSLRSWVLLPCWWGMWAREALPNWPTRSL